MQRAFHQVTRRAVVTLLLLASTLALVSGCKTLAGVRHTGVVIARRAQVRSSTAIVAADIKEVLRGDVVDIVEASDVGDPDKQRERWLRVRTHDAESTEGWIESRNVMPQELLERSLRLAEEDKNIPAQAAGQLRASANLRFSPDRGNNENILLKLESGSHFEIVGWKRVPTPKTSESVAESDDAPKPGSAQTNNRRRGGSEAARAQEAAKPQEDAEELWYKVRLTPDISPAPVGWVFGKQVELSVPSDIIFYRGGREFVAWHRLDEAEKGNSSTPGDAQPGSWVILEKSDDTESPGADQPDFDRIYVLGYDKTRQEHYTAYRSHDIRGRLPLRIEDSGGSKFFIIRAEDGKEVKDYRFKVYKDDRGHFRTEPVQELPSAAKKK